MNLKLKQVMFLVHNNVPWDEAFSLNDAWRQALCLMFSEFDGATVDHRTMQLVKTKVPTK